MECVLMGSLCPSNTCLINPRRVRSKRKITRGKFTPLCAHSTPSKQEFVWPSSADEIPFWENKFPCSNEPTTIDMEKDSNPIHIIHVTAEMAPIAKVGGLGDVVTGLARACLSRGHAVDIMLPFYECILRDQIKDLALITAYNSYYDGNWVPTNAYRGLVSGIPVIFIEPSNEFFKGQHVYGGSYNELEAYLFFNRACLEWMQVTGVQPDIIHVHEWQTGALPVLYWDMYQNLSLKKPRVVLTIHNMEHYGECSISIDDPLFLFTEKINSVNVVLMDQHMQVWTS